MVSAYPVQFDVDFPERPLNRLTSAFRFVLAIPILIVLGLLTGQQMDGGDHSTEHTIVLGGVALFVPLVLMLLFRQKYPRWWFDWNLNLLRFTNRVTVYMALLDDRYPSTDEEQAVHLEYVYPDTGQLNRWMPLVKWFLAIPHYVVLLFLWVASLVAVVIAWFAIIFTGRYPRTLFDFVVGVLRWWNRVNAYAFILVTDQYPPFRLS